MAPLLPIETLSFYLSKTGFAKFRPWFKSIELLQLIHNDLEELTYVIENSTWLEDKLRRETLLKLRNIIIKHIENKVKIEPNIYFEKWIESIQPYCFQGGFGYRIQYSGIFPHHWCVRKEHYDKVKAIPDLVKLCGVLSDKYINLADIAEEMIWGG